MTNKEKQQLKDIQAFIDYSLENDARFGLVLSTIGHDVGGLLNKDECFLPRTDGYLKMMAKKGKAA